jgi:hypothetical protein
MVEFINSAADPELCHRTAEGTRSFMVEYSGGGAPVEGMLDDVHSWNGDAPRHIMDNSGPSCSADASNQTSIVGVCSCVFGAATPPVHDQSPCDESNNTYACVRTLGPAESTIYCEFIDDESFVEYVAPFSLAAKPP